MELSTEECGISLWRSYIKLLFKEELQGGGGKEFWKDDFSR